MSVITRIAPSPTGYLHFGLARTALYCYLYARKEGGSFYMRIEDTDQARNKPEFEEDIHAQMAWLGLTPEREFKQSDHRGRHKECLKVLIEKGAAYESKEPSKEDPSKEVTVVRLKNPGERITFVDLIRGEISFDTTELGDFVIARSIDDPLYHMAVVVDDADEGVTHIIRGEDHISNTPRHILLQRALGFPTPHYAHIPLILMPDKSKMSKRKHESSLKAYREQGIVPEALINYLALLGWNPGGTQELFSLQELVGLFDIAKVHKAGAVFDVHKLLWFNHEYLKRLSDGEYKERLEAFVGEPVDARLIPLLKARAQTLGEAKTALVEEFGFLNIVFPESSMLTQGGKIAGDIASNHLKAVHELLLNVPDEGFTAAQLKDILWPYATSQGRGDVLWPLRVALSGKEKSPDPFTIMALIGKSETLSRIMRAASSL